MKRLMVICLFLFFPTVSHAEIRSELITYKQGDTVLEGYLAYDDAVAGRRPGVIVVHDWMGFSSFVQEKAKKLAELGYIALAVDIYGEGVRPQNTDEAATQAGIYKNDRDLLRRRAQAGYDVLKSCPFTDLHRIAAMGYCFGGTTVLEMARSGLDLKGVVSFHGGLDTTHPEDARKIKAKVLALHGADDPYVPPQQVQAFQKEMNDAKVDWQMIFYSGAVHAFTNKAAGNDNSKGVAYNPKADQRSWEAMKQFFEEIF